MADRPPKEPVGAGLSAAFIRGFRRGWNKPMRWWWAWLLVGAVISAVVKELSL
jgi:hypothetical protein